MLIASSLLLIWFLFSYCFFYGLPIVLSIVAQKAIAIAIISQLSKAIAPHSTI
ncbi:hypothetical protein [Nostoc sp. DedQUE03]|uniref:hypothetical protein n=1 Tax=Nostoc sp. DedQUE03 TaxID=3075389 RepID=UPI002ADD2E94|nr:hypothetical protein [Nostoc sp. DedQUE03]MDZ8043856.1 hypothetical protein [Nostoc sp. DedQUE02]